MSTTGLGPIPEGGILLHVGMHKTGTTALQGVLYALRDELPAHGVSYPYLGDPGQSVAHHIAARSLLQLDTGGNTLASLTLPVTPGVVKATLGLVIWPVPTTLVPSRAVTPN